MKTNNAKYYLYRNLHTGGFSIKHKGLVCARGEMFAMKNVEFKVSAAGSKRAKAEKQRNVHAFMVADNYQKRIRISKVILDNLTEITYNPYKFVTFVNAETLDPVAKASYAITIGGKVYAKID